MKTSALFALCLLLLPGSRGLLAQETIQRKLPVEVIASGGLVTAQAVADTWLGWGDNADYARCWQSAAGIFQRAVPQERWAAVANTRRTPLGKSTARRLRSATFMTSLPGAPPGNYVAAVYDSAFEHKPTAVETVTVALEPDGQWKVTGYFVK